LNNQTDKHQISIFQSHQFSPAWIYNQINRGRDSGSSTSAALNLLKYHGCDTLSGFPYDMNDYLTQPDIESRKRALAYKDFDWQYVANDVEQIKTILVNEQRPVIFRCSLKPDFYAISEDDPVFDDPAGSGGGHAMAIVGYDDELQAFKLVNSWGPDWGLSGFGWISYDFVVDDSPVGFGAYVLQNAENEAASQLWFNDTILYSGYDETIYYLGELYNSTSLKLIVDTNLSDGNYEIAMQKSGGVWKSTLNLDREVTSVTLKVADDSGSIDDNGGDGWSFAPIPAHSVNLSLTGRQFGEPVFATLHLVQSGKNPLSVWGSTDENGNGSFTGLKNGDYRMEILTSYFEPVEYESPIHFTIDNAHLQYDLTMEFVQGNALVTFDGPGINVYDSPIIGMEASLYQGDRFVENVTISRVYNSSYPRAQTTNLAENKYTLVLDSVKDGIRYSGSVDFTLGETTPRPEPVMTINVENENSRTIHYQNSSFQDSYIHYEQEDGSWTQVPGLPMAADGSGWSTSTVTRSGTLVFCFNDGNGNWDSRNGANYSTDLQECWVRDGVMYDEKPLSDYVQFQLSADDVPEGYFVKVRCSISIDIMPAWSYGKSLYLDDDGLYKANLYVTDGTSFEYKYTCESPTGGVIWEILQGNRTVTSPATTNDIARFTETTAFTIHPGTIADGLTCEVRGSFGANPWSGHKMTRNPDGSWSASLQIQEDSFEYKYTTVDANRTVVWEDWNGNRHGTKNSTFEDYPRF
jgi:hypothetical protein